MQDGYTQWKAHLLARGPRHYYGSIVRHLFLASAFISFVALPLWGSLLPFSLSIEICGGIVLVLLAGLTSPRNAMIMLLNALTASLGALLIEIVAINAQGAEPLQLLVAREIVALLLLLGFYFSVKTMRAMMLGMIGRDDVIGEFDESTQPMPEERPENESSHVEYEM
jgi:hypothetical protein